jgi:hypothetical protein
MNIFETTLGLTNKGGGYAFPLSFSIEPRRAHVKPAKNSKLYVVNLYSIRLKTNIELSFDNSQQAVNFIEMMNDNQYFIANIIK